MFQLSPRTFALIHGLMLAHHLITAVRSLFLDLNSVDHDIIPLLQNYGYCFLTFWNMMSQSFYLLLSLTIDIIKIKNDCQVPENLLKIQGLWFNTLLAPYTLFVCYMFWILYAIHEELALPPSIAEVLPPLLNHSVHTFILVPLIFELFFNKLTLPEHFTAMIVYTLYQVLYFIIMMYIFYVEGVWLYKVYAWLPLPLRILYILFNYASGYVIYILLYRFQQYWWRPRKSNKQFDRNDNIKQNKKRREINVI